MKNGLFRKRIFTGLAILLAVAFAGSTAFANELDDIRAAIHERGAHWVAGDTSVSKLPHHERQLRLGHVKHRLTGNETLLTAAGSTGSGGAAAAYTSFDWTYPTSYVTPVRNQGNCGSCWAFATTAALESYTLIKNSLPGQELNLAEQVMVSCGGAGSCGGGYIGSASNYIKNTGLPLDTCYPYTATNGTCSTACYNWQANSYKIAGWGYVATTAPTVDAIKNALVTYGPLVTTMDVYADFFSYHSGIYKYVSGTYQGGHADPHRGLRRRGPVLQGEKQLGHLLGRSGILPDRLLGGDKRRGLRRVHHRILSAHTAHASSHAAACPSAGTDLQLLDHSRVEFFELEGRIRQYQRDGRLHVRLDGHKQRELGDDQLGKIGQGKRNGPVQRLFQLVLLQPQRNCSLQPARPSRSPRRA